MQARASVVVPCSDIGAALAFYCGELGFRVELISPADDPRLAVVVGHGLRLRLDCDAKSSPPTIAFGDTSRAAPDGVTIERLVPRAMELPELDATLEVSRVAEASWVNGRAGMRYRDLIGTRYGGRFVASHIQVPDGGLVPDYVHYHRVRFQMIYCWRGWVRVVYEGQGEPFVLNAGDCVLQPPGIRHRVLEASPSLDVIELSSPATHDTCGDLDLELPDGVDDTQVWNGQRFVRHLSDAAEWRTWQSDSWEYRDTGIGVATGGFGAVIVARPSGSGDPAWREPQTHSGEIVFLFVLAGAISIDCPETLPLSCGDAISIPGNLPYRLGSASGDTELLAVRI